MGLSASGIGSTTITVNTTGSAGSATGSTTSGFIRGYLIGAYFDFGACPGTTDTTVSYADPANGNIIVLTNTATDAFHLIRKQCTDIAGAAITGVYDLFPINGTVTVSVAQCDVLTPALTVRLIYHLV